MAEDEDEPDYENVELQELDDDYDDIYANVETKTAPTAQDDSQKIQQSGPQGIRWNRRVGVGLLCAVLALIISIGVLLYLYHSNMAEKEQLTEERDRLQASFDQMMISHNNLTMQKDQLQTSLDQMMISHNLTEERDFRMRQRPCETPPWQKFGTGCYYISTEEEKNWTESRLWCRDRLSDLIVINSKEEQDFVDRFNKIVWLGLTDRDRNGSFQWVDGTTLTTPTYWQYDQPNNQSGAQHCVENYYGSKPGWNDIQCYASKIWICERVLY